MTDIAVAAAPAIRRWHAAAGRGLLAAALAVAVLIGTHGITQENALPVADDSPRHLMNGVFLYDFLRSGGEWAPRNAMSFAQRYFAQYPALSIGHHPPLWPITLVPFFALFGVSIFAARLAVLACFLLSAALLYTFAARVYDRNVAGWAALLFASNPFIAAVASGVPSEMLAVALVLAALNALLRFCDEGRPRDYALFVALAVSSVAARQIAVFMFPSYLALLLGRGGWVRAARRDVIVWTLAGAVLMVPIAVATVMFSPFNVDVVSRVARRGLSMSRFQALIPIAHDQLLPVLGLVTVFGLLAALIRRDTRIIVSLQWIVAVLASVLLVTGPVDPVRYSIFALPAYCLCGSSIVLAGRSRELRFGLTAVLAFAVASQLWWTWGAYPARAGAYEEAARFVVSDVGAVPAPTVLYSALIDSGNFVFFVRKHDPSRRVVVLRADKVLTTSLMGRPSVKDHIASANDIYPLLDRYGTRFVVIEDRPSGSIVLDWLRDELKSDRFIERRRISPALRGTSLIVYEYVHAKAPDPLAVIDMDIPLVGREIHVPLSDLRQAAP